MSPLSRTIVFGILLLSLCSGGFAQEEVGEESGFYFPAWDPQSKDDYVGVFPVSRRSSYYVYSAGQPAHLVGEVSGSPFVFHSGPQYCGWVGLPGLGWFGCGLFPHPPDGVSRIASTSGADDVRPTSITLEPGMGREEVMELVGSPTKKIFLGTKEIWEYTSYSLLFESNALKEIR